MTSRNQIAAWFDRGVAEQKKWMIVMCDTFDHDDYPIYFTDAAECVRNYKFPGEMQRPMECYDLLASKEEQLNERRANRLPAVEGVK